DFTAPVGGPEVAHQILDFGTEWIRLSQEDIDLNRLIDAGEEILRGRAEREQAGRGPVARLSEKTTPSRDHGYIRRDVQNNQNGQDQKAGQDGIVTVQETAKPGTGAFVRTRELQTGKHQGQATEERQHGDADSPPFLAPAFHAADVNVPPFEVRQGQANQENCHQSRQTANRQHHEPASVGGVERAYLLAQKIPNAGAHEDERQESAPEHDRDVAQLPFRRGFGLLGGLIFLRAGGLDRK